MDSTVIIQLSAFSGLAGALLTQALTGTFQYFGDKRKAHNELKSTYRSKQIDIAESFYYVTGEKMAIIKKNIDYWQNRNNSRSNESLEFLTREIKKMNAYMDKLDAEHWKFTLVGLYFDVTLTGANVISSNERSKELYLKVLDLSETIKHALPDSIDDLYGIYGATVEEMCKQYQNVFDIMTNDLEAVKQGVAREFRK